MQPTGDAELFAGGDFAFDVELGGRIFSYEDRGEAGTDALGVEAGDFVLQFDENKVADFESIEDACGHAGLTFREWKGKNSIRGKEGWGPHPRFFVSMRNKGLTGERFCKY